MCLMHVLALIKLQIAFNLHGYQSEKALVDDTLCKQFWKINQLSLLLSTSQTLKEDYFYLLFK